MLHALALGLQEELLRSLGDALWPGLCEAYVGQHVKPAALKASQAGQAGLLAGLVQAAADLEGWATNMGFVEGVRAAGWCPNLQLCLWACCV